MTALLLSSLVLPVLLPSFALLALTLAALRVRFAAPVNHDVRRPRLAVLVPAHNESAHLLPTLRNLQDQLGATDRILVVADNCNDDTAALARAAGAEVVERHEPHRRGKGYALAHGVDHLRMDPPEVVLVVDADCLLGTGAVAAIACACQAQARPVQMLNLMSAPAGADLKLRVAEFAMLMKNWVRPLGTQRLGGACHLMGTGMAFPWPLMAQARLATGHVAEDMQLGVELTRAGSGPVFLPQARVSSHFVGDTAAVRRQKTRWEHGHLDTLRRCLPALLFDALRYRSRSLAGLAMDLCIPPLALYVSVLFAMWAAVGLSAAVWPAFRPAAALLTLAVAALALAVGLGWWHFGRHLLNPRELFRLPLYALWKLPVYAAYALGARSGWLRTPRAAATPANGEQGS